MPITVSLSTYEVLKVSLTFSVYSNFAKPDFPRLHEWHFSGTWRTTPPKNRHSNGQGWWLAKLAKSILDLLENAESNAQVHCHTLCKCCLFEASWVCLGWVTVNHWHIRWFRSIERRRIERSRHSYWLEYDYNHVSILYFRNMIEVLIM